MVRERTKANDAGARQKAVRTESMHIRLRAHSILNNGRAEHRISGTSALKPAGTLAIQEIVGMVVLAIRSQ